VTAVRRLLVANRGEVACRVFRTCARLGIETVAVFSDADRDGLHVRAADRAVALGGSTAADSYLDMAKLLAAARVSGADAVHPGYGFLAENAAFATAVVEAGLVWVGPAPETIALMGSKLEAKRVAAAAGVPVSPSAELVGDDSEAWSATALQVGFPLLVKASAGGGGKGMRLVRAADGLAGAVESCRREAGSAFGDPTVFAERYVEGGRHVEVQVFGDRAGNVVHLYERECSVQRRHQKVLEESPAPALADATRDAMYTAALALARAVDYVGAGTVELLVGADETFVFLEMNTRLQVEHAVTEAVTGVDLVEWQLAVAAGRTLPLGQDAITRDGHAIEVRVCAEDPRRDHLPSAGRLLTYRERRVEGVRIDAGIESGSEVTSYYDSLLAKVIARAATREEAAARLVHSLRGLRVDGISTNRDSLVAVLEHPAFLAGETPTTFLERHPEVLRAQAPPRVQQVHLAAAALAQQATGRVTAPVQQFAPSGFRNVPAVPQARSYARAYGGAGAGDDAGERRVIEVTYQLGRAGVSIEVAGEDVGDVRLERCDAVGVDVHVVLTVDGVRIEHVVATYGPDAEGERPVVVTDGRWTTTWTALPRFADVRSTGTGGGPAASLPGTVTQVAVQVGDVVTAGQTLVVIEAMKMEHRIAADREGVVAQLLVAVGDAVEAHQLVARVEGGETDG
jgi:propionyl-CoA carboxylase alpha chain